MTTFANYVPANPKWSPQTTAKRYLTAENEISPQCYGIYAADTLLPRASKWRISASRPPTSFAQQD